MPFLPSQFLLSWYIKYNVIVYCNVFKKALLIIGYNGICIL